MTQTEIRCSELADAEEMAPHLRKADREEMAAVLGEDADPQDVLRYGIEVSHQPFTALVDGKPICIFGAVMEPVQRHIAAIWMMGTPGVEEHKMFFLRHSKQCLDKLFEPFSLLWNCVDKRNELHIKWIKWLGFSFLREISEYGEQGKPFLEFAKIKEDV